MKLKHTSMRDVRAYVRTYVRTYAKISDPWSSSERAMNPRCDSASQLANTSTNHQRKHIGIKQRDLNTMGQTQWNMRNHESMSHAQNEVPKWGYVRTYARTYVGTYVCMYVRTYVRTFSCPGHIVSINKLSFAFRKISGTYVRISLVAFVPPAPPAVAIVPLAFVFPVFCGGFKETHPLSKKNLLISL